MVADATVDVPDALVEARARELWERMLHSLAHQGISKDAYLRIARQDRGGDPRRGQARRRAGAQARGRARRGGRGRGASSPPTTTCSRRSQASAAQQNTTPEKLRERLERNGRLDDLREDIAQRRRSTSSSTSAKASRSAARVDTALGADAARCYAL